jgi:uncharacterized membrane protein YedE/YeeE
VSRKAEEPRGAISRLYREFTDPSASGDTLNMLRKYADGLVPGCMGLLFLAVGILVIVLFSRQIVSSDKKTYLPLLFGLVFALAGFGVARLGLSTILKKAGRGSADDDDGDSASK